MTAVPVPRNLAQDVATFVSTMVIIRHVAHAATRGWPLLKPICGLPMPRWRANGLSARIGTMRISPLRSSNPSWSRADAQSTANLIWNRDLALGENLRCFQFHKDSLLLQCAPYFLTICGEAPLRIERVYADPELPKLANKSGLGAGNPLIVWSGWVSKRIGLG
jgi:hypothetical protein